MLLRNIWLYLQHFLDLRLLLVLLIFSNFSEILVEHVLPGLNNDYSNSEIMGGKCIRIKEGNFAKETQTFNRRSGKQ